AVVVREVAVLDRLQAGDEQFRDVVDLHQAALFLLLPVQGRDARGIEHRRTDRLVAGEVAQLGDLAAGDDHLDAAGPDLAADVLEPAAGDAPAPALVLVGAGADAGAVVAVGGGVQLGLERGRVQ